MLAIVIVARVLACTHFMTQPTTMTMNFTPPFLGGLGLTISTPHYVRGQGATFDYGSFGGNGALVRAVGTPNIS